MALRQVFVAKFMGELTEAQRQMHVARTLDALDCANRAEAVRKVATLGLLD